MNATDSTKDESPEVEATDTRPLAPATARTPYRPGEGRAIAWNRRARTPTCSRGRPRGRRSALAREGRNAGRGRGVRTRRQTRRKEGEPKQPSGLDRTSARGNSSEARGNRACSVESRAREVANRRKRHAGRTRGETRRTEVRSSHEAMSREAEVPRERRTREGEERGPGEARTHDCSTSRARPGGSNGGEGASPSRRETRTERGNLNRANGEGSWWAVRTTRRRDATHTEDRIWRKLLKRKEAWRPLETTTRTWGRATGPTTWRKEAVPGRANGQPRAEPGRDATGRGAGWLNVRRATVAGMRHGLRRGESFEG